MTTETEISTPVETVEDTSATLEPETVETVEDTSVDTEPEAAETVEDTSTAEPKAVEPAETETQVQKLYADKYNSIEELEKGYKEAEKYIKKYNDLLEAQQKAEQQQAQQKLQQAQYRGFETVEAQEIADRVQVAEFEYYWNNLNSISPENAQNAEEYLRAYYQTANPAYLEEAKRYYTSDFIGKVAIATNDLRNQLSAEYRQKETAQAETQMQELATVLKADYAEFLADVSTNQGKAEALKAFCNTGHIQSKEDMQAFANIYDQIAKYERELAIKEYEAKKVIAETKQKAVIDTGASVTDLRDGLKDSYTAAEIGAMSMEQYNALCDKYGEHEITKRIK